MCFLHSVLKGSCNQALVGELFCLPDKLMNTFAMLAEHSQGLLHSTALCYTFCFLDMIILFFGCKTCRHASELLQLSQPCFCLASHMQFWITSWFASLYSSCSLLRLAAICPLTDVRSYLGFPISQCLTKMHGLSQSQQGPGKDKEHKRLHLAPRTPGHF